MPNYQQRGKTIPCEKPPSAIKCPILHIPLWEKMRSNCEKPETFPITWNKYFSQTTSHQTLTTVVDHQFDSSTMKLFTVHPHKVAEEIDQNLRLSKAPTSDAIERKIFK